jgi:hypothetical protein
MGRPIYSFEFTQSGNNMLIDACVPLARGSEFLQLMQARAKSDGATIAHKRSAMKLAKDPEFQVRSITPPWTKTKKAVKSAPKVTKRRATTTTKTPD